MPGLGVEGALHTQHRATGEPLGAWGGLKAIGPDTEDDAYPPPDSVGLIRHAEGLDGRHHSLTRTLERVSTEMSLHVLAYNFKRALNLLGNSALMADIRR